MTAGDPAVPAGTAVLVSGFDPSDEGRGGLFSLDGHELRTVDRQYTTGLRVHDGQLIRCLWNAGRGHADLLVTGADGRCWHSRLDGVGNPHDVIGDGDLAVVVATEQNQVVWFRADGTRARTWHPGGEPDSWHLNSLVRHDGRLLVCAFGRFTRRKEWDELGQPASGCVVDLETGEVLIDGLRAPHTPRYIDGRWLVCNSADGEVVSIAPDGSREVLVAVDGWPRGLAVTPDAVLVGVSPARHALSTRAATSRLVVVDRATRRVVTEVEVPAREVYDLELVPADLVGVLGQGVPPPLSVPKPWEKAAGF